MTLTVRAWILVGVGGLISLLGIARPALFVWVVPYDLLVAVLVALDALWLPRAARFRVARLHEAVLSLGTANRLELMLSAAISAPLRVRLRDEPPPDCTFDQREFDVLLRPEEPALVHYHLTPLYRVRRASKTSFCAWRGGWDWFTASIGCPHASVCPSIPTYCRCVSTSCCAIGGCCARWVSARPACAGWAPSSNRCATTPSTTSSAVSIGKRLRDAASPSCATIRWSAARMCCCCSDAGRNMLAEVEGMRKFDAVLNTGLMLAYVATQMDDKVGALVFADEIDQFIPPQRGRGQVAKLVQQLHAVQPRMVEADYLYAITYLAQRWRKRSLMVLFTDLIDPDASRVLLQAMAGLARQHLCVCVTVSDPRLHAWSQQTPRTAEQLYRRAIATQVLTDRLAAARTLERMGIATIDAEPETLVSALVNFYLQVKARGGL
jgi:uncharacterized protein (DUF58 family)